MLFDLEEIDSVSDLDLVVFGLDKPVLKSEVFLMLLGRLVGYGIARQTVVD